MYRTGEEIAVLAGNRPRHFDFNAVRATHLLTFDRYRYRAAKNNQVIEYPQQADPHGEDFILWSVHVTPDPKRHAQQVQQYQVDIRSGDHPIDVLFFYQSALGSDVELAFMRGEQRHHSRRRNVPGQHRFIDFTPEGVAVFTLNF